jgi:dTDP-4-amino-4,6-dideoxygalactose transaminase
MIPINKPFFDNEEIEAMIRVMQSGILTSKSGAGLYVTQFEEAFARYIGTKYAIALNSGTAALHSSLLAAGVCRDDEVIVPSFTFVATAEMIALIGAKPVFTDIDPNTYCINPRKVEKAITEKTKAIIPVHLYGLTADMQPLLEIAKDHNLVLIEDAAQAHGAEYHSSKAGNLGDLACFSFYGSKNMVTGEGGMVTTNNKEQADQIRIIRNHGEVSEYQSSMIGHNYRMPELEAAIGVVQLRKLTKFLEDRQRNATILTSQLNRIEDLKLPTVPREYKHAWYVFTIRLINSTEAKRNRVVNAIRNKKVGASVYYSKPIHLLEYYQKMFGSYSLPETEEAAKQVFSLPVHPGISETELVYISKVVKEIVQETR